MNTIGHFLRRIRATAERRSNSVKTIAMGRERVFRAYDLGEDTFIFEDGIVSHLQERPSVLVVAKTSLGRNSEGRVLTLTTGNHSVAAFPLLDGRFWGLSRIPSNRRGEVLMNEIVCGNVVGSTIEISQRDVATERLVAADGWLRESAGFGLNDIVMSERNVSALDHFRRLGQEWRVRPLAWTENEMKTALAASRKRIATSLTYYHSTKGVHFLSFSEFRRFAALAETDPNEFVKCLRELVSVYEGHDISFTRMPKHRGHHEIEFFGIRRGLALERLIPQLESLMEAVALNQAGQISLMQRMQEIVSLYESMLSRPELADDTTKVFVETIYMYVTGEIYSVSGEGSTPAFDDRRTALPGATYVDGRPINHPGIDNRTEILLSNISALMSKDEHIEYANVYELRSKEEDVELGRGKTREIVYKTNWCPIERSLVEKRLSRAAKGYGSYMLVRVDAFKALGVSLSDYRLLRRRSQTGRCMMDYYMRKRCEGEPMDAIPQTYFRSDEGGTAEESSVVQALAMLMGDAAAQNMAMKKYDPETQTPLYGVGKEIYEFEYDIAAQRVMPKRVSTCSVRGSCGWPDCSFTDENLHALGSFYMQHFAHALKVFQRAHGVPMAALAERFMDGFEHRTHAMDWQLSVMRDKFEDFSPVLPRMFDFAAKWRFVMWALERQERRLPTLRRMFFEKVKVVENEDLRSDS